MSTRYEERLETDLEVIRERVHSTSELVEDQVREVVHALLEDDQELASKVILGDRRVNRRIRDIDHLCHAFIVRHSPSAGHLRYVSAVLRLGVALERVGDYASTIGREVVQLAGKPPKRVARDIELISQQGRRTLHEAIASFHSADVERARTTYGLADQTDATLQKVFAELVRAAEKEKAPIRDIFRMLRILNLLKRVAEQAENICQQTLFAIAGETKDPKVFRILFIDETDDCATQMAKAYCQKAYPESGVYSSAGWTPAKRLHPGLVEFLESKRVNLHDAKPVRLRPVQEEPLHFHLIVGLHPGARDHVEDLPFRSVFLSWGFRGGLPEAATKKQFNALYKKIAANVQDLMHTLRGRDAR
jgi:phosphate transport system protein